METEGQLKLLALYIFRGLAKCWGLLQFILAQGVTTYTSDTKSPTYLLNKVGSDNGESSPNADALVPCLS